MAIDSNEILFLAILGQSILLLVSIFARRHNNPKGTILFGFIVLSLGFISFSEIIVQSAHRAHFSHILNFEIPISFLVPICLFLYVEALTLPDFRFTRDHLRHLWIPFIVTLAFTPLFFADEDLRLNFNTNPEFLLVHKTIGFLLIFVGLRYLYSSLRRVKDFEKMVKDRFSELEFQKIKWLKYLLVIFGLLWTTLAYFYLTTPKDNTLGAEINLLVICSTLYLLSAFIMKRSRVFEAANLPQYKTSGMSEEDVSKYAEKIKNVMEEKNLYSNPEFKLKDLADEIRLQPYQVSHVLNAGLKQSFYEMVNSYRVIAARKLLKDPSYQFRTILSISNDVGFSTKSTFNSVFKKHTGSTPSQYRDLAN